MRIVGIVNMTADSFSDGGRYLDPQAAIAHARKLAADGADVIEVGAQSTHPDARIIPAGEEIARLAPVLDELVRDGHAVGVDTAQPEVMRFAIERGAAMLNDVTGFRQPGSIEIARHSRAKVVIMHAVRSTDAGTPASARAERIDTRPESVIESAERFLAERAAALMAAGVERDRIVIDPGMGFFLGSQPEPSLAMLRALPRIRAMGYAVLISVSRKSFIGALLGGRGEPVPVEQRAAGTLAAELWAYTQGVEYVRTHDVRALRDAVTLWRAIRDGDTHG